MKNPPRTLEAALANLEATLALAVVSMNQAAKVENRK